MKLRFPTRTRMLKSAICLVVLLCVFCFWVNEGSACPNCKEAVANESHDMQQGYVLSILLMMGTPFAIMAGWSFAIYRAFRQRKINPSVA